MKCFSLKLRRDEPDIYIHINIYIHIHIYI